MGHTGRRMYSLKSSAMNWGPVVGDIARRDARVELAGALDEPLDIGLSHRLTGGADLGIVTLYGAQPDIGFGGGAGVSHKFEAIPAEALSMRVRARTRCVHPPIRPSA